MPKANFLHFCGHWMQFYYLCFSSEDVSGVQRGHRRPHLGCGLGGNGGERGYKIENAKYLVWTQTYSMRGDFFLVHYFTLFYDYQDNLSSHLSCHQELCS